LIPSCCSRLVQFHSASTKSLPYDGTENVIKPRLLCTCHKMQPTVADVAWSAWCVCLCVCWIQPGTLPKRLNRSRCHLACELEYDVLRGGPDSATVNGAFWGRGILGHALACPRRYTQHTQRYTQAGSSDAVSGYQSMSINI